jgi:hypothetical protein
MHLADKNTNMTKSLLFLLAIGLFSGNAMAQFTNCYDAANWTVNSANTNGSVYTTPNYFDLIADTDGSGNGTSGLDCSTSNNGNVSTCITIPAAGILQFTWLWTGGNNSTLATEPFGYCLNGTAYDLTANVNYSGTATVNVAQGDQFCFVVSSQLANSHPTLFTYINISQFSAPCTPAGIQQPSATAAVTVLSLEHSILLKGTKSGGELVLFDSMGKEVQRTTTSGAETPVATDELESGLYFIRYAQGATLLTTRVVKW